MNDHVTLLLEGKSSSRDWSVTAGSRNLVRVPSFAMLEAALDAELNELGFEVESVILDRSVTAAQYLEFLSALTPAFRGDVVAINPDSTGFLSAVTPHDGRVLYRLSSADIDFYMTVRFGAERFGDRSWDTEPERLQTGTYN